MGIEQFLTTDDKKAALEKLTYLLASEIYYLSLKFGMDPDELDYSSFTAPLDDSGVPFPHLLDIENKCKSLHAAQQKLAELNNA
jgi:hypothetical protein